MLSNIQLPEGFDWDIVPIEYQWSGYSANCEEFKAFNFHRIETDGNPLYICSSENGVALGDYLSKYIFKQSFIRDMEAVFSPGYDYWFFKAWELAAPNYEELDLWVHHIVDLLVASDLIACVEFDNCSYFAFSHLCDYESQILPTTLLDEAKAVCEKDLLSFCQQSLDNCGSTDELATLDVGAWADTIIQRFISAHTEIEVEVECYSEKADVSIWCGVYAESVGDKNLSVDPESLFLTLAESFWENYREFEEGVAEAECLKENNPNLTYQQALESVFGHFVLSFKVDDHELNLDVDANADEFMYSLLSEL